MKKILSFGVSLLAATAFCLCSTGCTTKQRELERSMLLKAQEQVQEQTRKNNELQQQNEEQEKLLINLQADLLAKHAEVNHYLQVNEKLVNELVKSKKDLRTKDSRREALNLVAETSAFMGTFPGKSLSSEQKAMLKRAQKHLAEVKEEIAKENYAGGAYLCAKVMEQLQRIESERIVGKTNSSSKEEVLFSIPLKITLTKAENMYKKPSAKSGIISVLERGTTIEATGYRKAWVKITASSQNGWIQFSAAP